MTPAHWARLFLVGIVALLLQAAVLNEISVLGAHPDVMVVLAAAAGLVAGAPRGAGIGFFLGLLADLVVPTPYGLSCLTFVLLAFGAGAIRSVPTNWGTPGAQIAACTVAAALGTLLFEVIGALVGQPGMLSPSGGDTILVVALGAIVLSPLALGTLRWALAGADQKAVMSVPTGGSASR